jgi:hypothetical protein
MDGKAGLVGVVVGMLLASSSPGGTDESAGSGLQSPRIRIAPRAEAAAIRAAILGAARRLARPSCRSLFAEFKNPAGAPLQSGLDALGVTPEGYLGLVGFYDGRSDHRCSNGLVLAFTAPGHRTVRVCPQFMQKQLRDPGLAEVVVLHEVLHTLGLGENPPLSTEITRRVATGCGR